MSVPAVASYDDLSGLMVPLLDIRRSPPSGRTSPNPRGRVSPPLQQFRAVDDGEHPRTEMRRRRVNQASPIPKEGQGAASPQQPSWWSELFGAMWSRVPPIPRIVIPQDVAAAMWAHAQIRY